MLAHIVPVVPPAINGLGDYCYKLWEHWPSPRPLWHCFAAHIPVDSKRYWPEVESSSFALSRDGLLRALSDIGPTTAVLHYVGYAYQKRGCPLWLPEALFEWKRRSSGRLVVMFHELYACGKPWQTAFWLMPVARKIACDLAKIADVWITNSFDTQAKLLSEAGSSAAKGAMIPVGSNITPACAVDFSRPWPLFGRKKLRLVLFGLPATRVQALRAHHNLIKMLCDRGLVDKITIIGKRSVGDEKDSEDNLRQRIGHPNLWSDRYDLSAVEISEILLKQDLGFISNWPSLLTKSTVSASFCTHGTLIVSTQQAKREFTPLIPSLTNDDKFPDICLQQLFDRTTVITTKARMQKVSLELLDWRCITQQWSEIIYTRANDVL